MRVPNICLLTHILPSNSSFFYHPTNILFVNLRNLSLGIVFDNFSFLLISRHFVLAFCPCIYRERE